MANIDERVKELEEELTKTKYNKATQFHLGLVKAKIARLKEEAEIRSKKGGVGMHYAIKKTGDATALLVGFPSVGKSTLINKLTNADSKVAEYEFTTLTVIPGMMEYKGARIQLLDVPGIVEGAATGKGRGREVLSVVRNADLVIMIVDSRKPQQLAAMERELYNANLRLNKSPPDVIIKRKAYGGLSITITAKLKGLDEALAKSIIMEYGIHNADVILRQPISVDELLDVLSGNRKYVPSLVVYNKSDLKRASGDGLHISAQKGENLGALRENIFKSLQFYRIYMKKIGEEPDMEEPLVIRGGHTVRDVCKRLHKDFERNFQFARIWGSSAKFGGQSVGSAHELEDGDIVELHMRR